MWRRDREVTAACHGNEVWLTIRTVGQPAMALNSSGVGGYHILRRNATAVGLSLNCPRISFPLL